MRLFISYAHKDLKDVKKIVDLLRKAGHTTWFDEALIAGQDWRAKLKSEIESSAALVFMISPRSVASEWCQWELKNAIEMGKPIIPVLLEATLLTDVLANLQYADFSHGKSAEATAKLLGGLGEITYHILPENAPAAPEHPAGDPERLVINQTIEHISGGIVVSQVADGGMVIGTQTNISEGRNWTTAAILGLIIALLSLIVAFFTLFPEQDRANLLHSVGLVAATQTPTPTTTPTLTPTTTPTSTPTFTPTATPSLESHQVGIAVSYFAIPDDGSVDAQEADDLLNEVYALLESELTDFGRQTGLDIGFVSPAQMRAMNRGRVVGEDITAREEDARDIAKSYGADIVFYGDIRANSNGNLVISPEFYVNPEKFSEALEIAGPFRLGEGIEVLRGLDDNELNAPLRARTTALVEIFGGLVNYVAEDYTTAQAYFERAAALPNWEITQGREVLYVLLGNVYTKLASVAAQTGDLENALDKIDLAVAQYEAGIAENEDVPYARPYVGMASVTVLKWNVTAQIARAEATATALAGGDGTSQATSPPIYNLALLEEASRYLEHASRPEIEQSEDIGIRSKLIFTQLQIDFDMWYFHTDEFTDQELAALHTAINGDANLIIRNYGNGTNRSVRELSSEAHSLLGLMALREMDSSNAIDEFDEAITLASSALRRMRFVGWRGDSYLQSGNAALACTDYELAKSIAESLDEGDLVAFYQSKIIQDCGGATPTPDLQGGRG